MKSLTRDILITLIVKFSLLITLWLVCFKDVEKPTKNTQQWLLGSGLPSDATQPIKMKFVTKTTTNLF